MVSYLGNLLAHFCADLRVTPCVSKMMVRAGVSFEANRSHIPHMGYVIICLVLVFYKWVWGCFLCLKIMIEWLLIINLEAKDTRMSGAWTSYIASDMLFFQTCKWWPFRRSLVFGTFHIRLKLEKGSALFWEGFFIQLSGAVHDKFMNCSWK